MQIKRKQEKQKSFSRVEIKNDLGSAQKKELSVHDNIDAGARQVMAVWNQELSPAESKVKR